MRTQSAPHILQRLGLHDLPMRGLQKGLASFGLRTPCRRFIGRLTRCVQRKQL